MNKYTYNYDSLKHYIEENNILLNNDYSKLKVTRDTFVEGKCCFNNCDENFNKRFHHIKKYGAFCQKCTKISRNLNFKKTCITKYGVENVFQLDNIKEKIIETNLVKYGVSNPTYSNEIREKIKLKNLEKYGVEHTCQLKEVIEKRKLVCFKKYGTYYPTQSILGKNKFKKTCLEKYGYENPQQNPEIADKTSKNSFRRKIYTMPSGNQITCQGYEPLALDKLINEYNILEDDIVTGCTNVPTIWYNDESSKKHRHYVDIFIPSQNKCIEVKSTWTAEKKKDNIFLKQTAGKELGYDYEIWIFDAKKQLVKII